MLDFLSRLDHAQAHSRRGDINQFDAGQGGFEITTEIQINVVELDAEALHALCQVFHSREIIGFFPIGISDIVAEGTARWLATIDRGCYRGCLLMVDDEAIAAAEIAIQEVRQIADIVIAREQSRIHLMLDHQGPDRVLAALHFAG